MGIPYMTPHAHSSFVQTLGGRPWMGGVTAGMGQYQRRDIAGKVCVCVWYIRMCVCMV